MKVQEIVFDALPFLDLKSERNVERFLARPADPKVAIRLLVHPNESLFEHTRLNHQVVNLEQELGLELGNLPEDFGVELFFELELELELESDLP